MKLEPSTTARLGRFGPSDDRSAVGERAQVVNVRQVGAAQIELDGLGAGREQERVVASAFPSSSTTRLRAVSIDLTRTPSERDPMLARRTRGDAGASIPRGALPAK